MPRLQIWSQLGHLQEETNQRFSSSLFPSLSLSLKIKSMSSMSLGEDYKKKKPNLNSQAQGF